LILTHKSAYNHTYARRPLAADPGFYAFWADGHGRRPSSSRLYFLDRSSWVVFKLPVDFGACDYARPEEVSGFRGSKDF